MAPGPLVARQTPTSPVHLAWAQAIDAAEDDSEGVLAGGRLRHLRGVVALEHVARDEPLVPLLEQPERGGGREGGLGLGRLCRDLRENGGSTEG